MPEIDLTTHQRVVDRLIGRFFSEPIIENVWRGDYVECMIEALLAPDWHLTGTWDMWDLEHESGARIEIKTSSALQTWTTDKPSLSPSFDIKPRVEMWDQQTATTIPISPQRLADIYLFAWHPEIRRDLADHRRPEQWRFFIVPEHHFYPSQKTISLGPVQDLANKYGAVTNDHRNLHENIESIRKTLTTLKANSPMGGTATQSGSQITQIIPSRSIPDTSDISPRDISAVVSEYTEIVVPPISQESVTVDLPRFPHQPGRPFSIPERRSLSPNQPLADDPITPEGLLDLIPEDARDAVSQIFELARRYNAEFKPRKQELIIGFNTPAWRSSLNLMWFTRYGGIRNAWGRNATFGWGGGSFNKKFPGPELQDVLDRWGETVARFPHVEVRGNPSKSSKLWELEYGDLVEQCDNICEQLTAVITDLTNLPHA